MNFGRWYYYGVFHFTLAAAADQFIGATQRSSPFYTLVYRETDHKTLRDLCEEVKKPTPAVKCKIYVPAGGFGVGVIAFATALVELYEKRHQADYDPSIPVKTSDALAALQTARAAVNRFQRSPLEIKKAFLTLLLFQPPC